MPPPLVPEKIPFTIRESPRARRMRLIVHASGLEVVLPRGVRRERADRFVEANREWALRTLEKVRGRIPLVPQNPFQDLPLFAGLYNQPPPQISIINLRSIGRVYTVNYIRVPMLRGRATLLPQKNSRSRQLNVYCANPDSPPQSVVAGLLREWLREKAKLLLPETINSIADEIGIRRPSQIRIGFQRTVWAADLQPAAYRSTRHSSFFPKISSATCSFMSSATPSIWTTAQNSKTFSAGSIPIPIASRKRLTGPKRTSPPGFILRGQWCRPFSLSLNARTTKMFP